MTDTTTTEYDDLHVVVGLSSAERTLLIQALAAYDSTLAESSLPARRPLRYQTEQLRRKLISARYA